MTDTMLAAEFIYRVDTSTSESHLYWVLRELAEALGWLVHHETDSRRTSEGWPDLVLVRGAEIIIAELKSEKGKVTVAQGVWLDRLAICGIETHVWRPSQMEEIAERLK